MTFGKLRIDSIRKGNRTEVQALHQVEQAEKTTPEGCMHDNKVRRERVWREEINGKLKSGLESCSHAV